MRRIAGLLVLLVLVLAVVLSAQQRHPVSGRVIAPVMGVGGAAWLERPERESEEATSRAVEALDLKPGMVAADVGAQPKRRTWTSRRATPSRDAVQVGAGREG